MKPNLLVQLEMLSAGAEYRAIPITILPHAEAVPLGVMVRGAREWILDEQVLQKLLEDHAPEQYTRQLTIAALVNLRIQVSAGAKASVFSAFTADQQSSPPSIHTSFQTLYGKCGGSIPPSAKPGFATRPVIWSQYSRKCHPSQWNPSRISDANCGWQRPGGYRASAHGLAEMAQRLKTLVVYEPTLGLVRDLVGTTER